MSALVLEGIALVAVVLSIGLAALVVTDVHRTHAGRTGGFFAGERPVDAGDVAETMARVLAEVERLATLRERGVLTRKEFVAQKTKLLDGHSGVPSTSASVNGRVPSSGA